MIQSEAGDRVLATAMKGIWPWSLLLIYLLLIARVANTQDNTMSEQNKATDITNEITEEDLASARELLGKYLVGPVPETVELASAIAVRDMKMLAMMFDSADDSFGRDAKYIVKLIQQAQDETWQLNEIGIQAQHVVPGEDKPVFSQGAIRSDTAAELVGHVHSFLESSGAGRTRISGVGSNEPPPLYSFPASMGEAPKAIVYHVHVENTEPEKLYVPPDAEPGKRGHRILVERGFGRLVGKGRERPSRDYGRDFGSVAGAGRGAPSAVEKQVGATRGSGRSAAKNRGHPRRAAGRGSQYPVAGDESVTAGPNGVAERTFCGNSDRRSQAGNTVGLLLESNRHGRRVALRLPGQRHEPVCSRTRGAAACLGRGPR